MKNTSITARACFFSAVAYFILTLVMMGCDDPKATPSGKTDLLTFSIKSIDSQFTINKEKKSVTNQDPLPFGTDVSSLVAVFTVPEKATVTVGEKIQVSGETANDFSSPVTYTVTAEDGKTGVSFTVTVSVAEFAWTRVATDAFVKMEQPKAFAYDDKLWLAGAVNVGLSRAVHPPELGEYHEYIYSSADGGATWSTVHTNTVGGNDSVPLGTHSRMVSFNDKLVNVGGIVYTKGGFGLSIASGLGLSLSMDKGKTWSTPKAPIEGVSVIPNPNVLQVGSTLFIIGFQGEGFGSIQQVSSMDVYSSTDGSTWSEVAKDVLDTLAAPTFYSTVYFKEAMYIAGGVETSFLTKTQERYPQKVYKSTDDGATWQVATEDGFPRSAGSQVVEYKGKLYAIAGAKGDGTNVVYSRDVYVSEDAATWTKLTGDYALPEEFESRAFHSAVVMDGKIYIIGGENAAGGLNDVWVGEF